MAIETLRALFARDLGRLRKEVESYQNESNLWRVEHNIPNSAGNLCLHLVGNLNTFIGKEIGKTNYVRDRPKEFSLKDTPRTELLSMIDDTIVVVNESLNKVDERALKEEYPIIVFEEKTSMEYMLIHLATHLAYHLGQINYHRRLIDK
jgi:hypothetical protein